MATGFAATCDIAQGYSFKQDEHHTFGYIHSLVIGDSTVPSDITGTDPASLATRKVVAVLEQVEWSTRANENISMNARVSAQNASQLRTLATQIVKKTLVKLSFVVYRYDPVAQTYYSHFLSFRGTNPKDGQATGSSGFGGSASQPIFALFGKTGSGALGINLSPGAQEDPLGIQNYTLELMLAPPVAKAPQQILIQSSNTLKTIQPWGLPQS